MKIKLLLISAIAIPTMAMALVSDPPPDIQYKTGMYGLKISQNGKYVGSMAGDASVYDISKNLLYDYWSAQLGLGNCIADNGVTVGDANDHATILFEGNIIYPPVFEDYWFTDLNAITPDATRLVGIVNNPSRGQRYLPFYCDIDENMNVGKINFLPYPTKDFFGTSPQYSSAVWISNDGKTIVGEMVDGRGLYTVPVVYLENEEGEWSYYLPSEKLFNPTDLPLPKRENNQNQPKVPNYIDYMSNVERMAYEQAYEAWQEAGYPESLWPDPLNYMSEQEREAYQKALDAYNKWAAENDPNGEFKSYEEAYNDILKTSPSFSQNEMTIDPLGEFIMVHGFLLDDNFEEMPHIYRFSTRSNDYMVYDLPLPYSPYPSLVLSDGTVLASTRLMEVPTSFVLAPESTEFVPFYDYVGKQYPKAALWLEENFPNGSGLVSMSDDKAIMIGALMPDQLADFDYEFSDFYYSTYIFSPGSDLGGVKSLLSEPSDGVYKVFNLQGVKIMETINTSELLNLGSGIYLINGKKVLIK